MFEFWFWTRVLRPMMAVRNPRLHDELPVTIFRWLFQKGGLTMSLYCYFEAAGVGYDTDISLEEISPWLTANSSMILHLTFFGVLGTTVLADSRTSLSEVLRGKAPRYLAVGLAASMGLSLFSLAMFAGREFSNRQQRSLYSVGFATLISLWLGVLGFMAVGHSSRRDMRSAKTASELATATASEDKGSPGQRGRGITFSSSLSGGATITTGI